LKFYTPVFYWLLKLSPEQIANVVKEILSHDKATGNRIVCRMAILLGPKATAWLKAYFDHRWHRHPQPPEHVFYFKRMVSKSEICDRMIVALQESIKAEITFADSQTVCVAELLKSPQQASACLSKACMSVFSGDMTQRTVCRKFDILAYGAEFSQMEGQVLAALEKEIRQ
jgi:hypothetical protein